MKTRRLGSSGPEISAIGFGALHMARAWGRPAPTEGEALAVMHAAFDAGINWVDTAEGYGMGLSEELVGKAVARREGVLVFTKVAPGPQGSGHDAAGIRAAAEASLARLGRDRIDLFQLHFPDPSVQLGESWEAMMALEDDGLVRHIGLSNYGREAIAGVEGMRHVDCLQPQFSLLHREGRRDLLPFCESNGTGVICFGPLAFGLLTGTVTRETEFAKGDWRPDLYAVCAPENLGRNLDLVDRLKPIAEGAGISLAQLALAWVVAQPGVTGAIAGSRSPEHIQDSAAAGSLALEAETLAAIEAVIAV